MTSKRQVQLKEQELSDIAAADYATNMFKDGDNRAAFNRKVHNAPEYDRAVRTTGGAFTDSVDNDAAIPLPEANTLHSRDGTEASGEYDETGGPVGGTEKEIDNLETTAVPVDRTPQMKK
jgi:hypothetical protein